MVGIVGWILFGLIVGVIAKLIMPGRDPGGIIVTMLLGIVGAVLGGFLGRSLGFYGPQQAAGWLMSIVGAIVVLMLYRVLVHIVQSSQIRLFVGQSRLPEIVPDLTPGFTIDSVDPFGGFLMEQT